MRIITCLEIFLSLQVMNFVESDFQFLINVDTSSEIL